MLLSSGEQNLHIQLYTAAFTANQLADLSALRRGKGFDSTPGVWPAPAIIGCSGIYVPSVYSHAKWKSPYATQVYVTVSLVVRVTSVERYFFPLFASLGVEGRGFWRDTRRVCPIPCFSHDLSFEILDRGDRNFCVRCTHSKDLVEVVYIVRYMGLR